MRPDVVVIGSSRVLQMRAASFNGTFFNLGRTANYVDEAAKVVDDLLKIVHPRVILLGVDFWWFNPNITFAFNFDTHRIRGGKLTSDALMAPARWLLEGKMTPATFADILFAGHPVKVGGVPMFGVQAVTRGNGFAGDGSYYHLGTVYGRGPVEDSRFTDTLGRIARNTSQFRRATAPDEQRLAALGRLLARLEEKGIRVITFLPPLAPRVLAAMAAEGDAYGYINAVRRRIAALSRYNYDFHDAAAIGAGDCEFVDGFHGGDVVFARMLAAIADDEANGFLPLLNRDAIRTTIAQYAGRAIADNPYRLPGEAERDFLELGCKKS